MSQHQDDLIQTYEALHALAEPSGKEEKTSHYLQSRLKDAGYHVHSFARHYGFYVDYPGGTEEVIALRADMDALVQEVDGEVRPNHSCGHDGHSTMVLHTALKLAETGEKPHHTVRFIFQPAEETAAGALQMMESGALANVKFLGGIHLRPEQEVPDGKAAPVILHGAIITLKVTIKGVPAHAARPELANNPIEAAGRLMSALRSVHVDHPYSLKPTELHSGEAANLIPETARMTFDIRSVSNDGLEELIDQTKAVIEQVEEETGTSINSEWVEFSPAAVQNDQAVQLAAKAVVKARSEEALAPACVSPGAEDFHFYTYHNKGLSATMIGLGCGLAPGLHHPAMDFNKQALHTGRDILYEMLWQADQVDWKEGAQ
ncbi:amidohydrolase [Halobacillus litoralis]|uniref:amidohydrolase n=1 Tax=Halobacillus litoralis TaxID=45668 RepID=UPI001CD2C571|nr:amidohydrolase [Halobacillus litoralis]MCA1021120.1 amidohydrolase [Halobacillus litoralis]